MMRKYLKPILAIAILFFLAAGCDKFLGQPRDASTVKVYNQAEERINQAQSIKYTGQDGRSALELLKGQYQVETKSFSFGEMVEKINGVGPDSKHFWAFYVNGELANVGADSYVTKNSDQIEWKLEEIK